MPMGLEASLIRPSARRITFLINSMEGGGAERAMANLLLHLQSHLADDHVELLLLDDVPTEQTLPDNLKVVPLDGRGKLVRSLVQLSRYWASASHRPDVCISFLARANVVNVVLSKRFGHRAIISERVHTSSHISASRAEPVLRWITRNVYPRAEHVVAVSAGVAEDLSANFNVQLSRLSVIGNPIDGTKLRRLAAEPPSIDLPQDYLLGVGRLVANKNFSLTIRALAAEPNAPPLVILGQGPEEAALRALAQDLGISDRVLFAGFVQNPYPVMARARVLVSASRAEGFPNTLIEAMTLGCPVIATDCPSGPADVLGTVAARSAPWPADGSGLLVPVEDTGALSAAIATFCDDAVRQDYAARAAKKAVAYGSDSAIAAYLDLICKHGVERRDP